MDKSGSRAIRGDFKVHTDTELVSMQQEDERARQEEADQQLSELTAIASLNDHPGFRILRSKMEAKIAEHRSGATLKAMILTGDVSNEQLGELARTTNLVADELEIFIMSVDASVEARKEELDGKRRPQRRKL